MIQGLKDKEVKRILPRLREHGKYDPKTQHTQAASALKTGESNLKVRTRRACSDSESSEMNNP